MDIINTFLAIIGKVIGLIVLLGAFLTGATTLPPQPIATDSASTTSSGQASFPQATTATVKTTVKKEVLTKPIVQEALPKSTVPTKSQEQINIETRAALVNILCTSRTGINGISGSGIIVDSRGVILTNAHVGQYFLLRDYINPGNITCTVRIGSPAQERYTATLLYLPPA